MRGPEVTWSIRSRRTERPRDECKPAMVCELEPHEYTASLSVFSETITLRDLTAALGAPSQGYDRGEPVSRRKPDGPKRKQAFWLLESTGQRARPLEDQIAELVGAAEEHREAFDALTPRPARRIFCGVFSGENAEGGFILEPALLDLDLVLVFDLY
jgi:hypothetical protein